MSQSSRALDCCEEFFSFILLFKEFLSFAGTTYFYLFSKSKQIFHARTIKLLLGRGLDSSLYPQYRKVINVKCLYTGVIKIVNIFKQTYTTIRVFIGYLFTIRATLLRQLCSDDKEERGVITVKKDDGRQIFYHQNKTNDNHYLCLLDSDYIMHSHRLAHQIAVLNSLPPSQRLLTLLGYTFDRIPADSTWHCTKGANSLTDEQLALEGEGIVLQPTWTICAKFLGNWGICRSTFTPK